MTFLAFHQWLLQQAPPYKNGRSSPYHYWQHYKQAKEIWRGEQYEQLKINLKKLKSIKIDLSFDLCTGSDKIKEHCNEQCRLVQLAYENKIQELKKNRQKNPLGRGALNVRN